ncbi:hypothetical protein BH24ACT7_BH24ACT7_24620 [soil metagenome]
MRRPPRSSRSLRRRMAIIEPRFVIDIDPVDVMLDLDAGMLDHGWVHRQPK